MYLEDYLIRIAYEGDVRPDLDCLKRIHRCHALTVPYENLDVQLERPLDQDPKRIFHKIVTRRRGGWCYEQNGLLGWVLSKIGFDVTRVAGAVDRREYGDEKLGNHLVLLVQLDKTYIVDLGIGDGCRAPLPLVEGSHQQGELSFQLERIKERYWRFHNHSFGVPASFDFRQEVADEPLLASVCHKLQVSPDSSFVQNFVAQIMQDNSVTSLTGKVMSVKTLAGTTKTVFSSSAELESTLAEVFGIEDQEIQSIWPKIEARHAALFGDQWGGSYESPAMQGNTADGSTLDRAAYFLEFAKEIAKQASMPIMTTGGIVRLAVAQNVLNEGVDMVGIGRALAFSPNLPEVWKTSPDSIAKLPNVKWKNKTMAAIATMAITKRQLQRMGKGKAPKPNLSPLISLIADQMRLKKLTKIYRQRYAKA